MECMRQYISELLDFIADMHTLTKLKVSPTIYTVFRLYLMIFLFLEMHLLFRAI